MRKQILEALKTKFEGVSEQVLGRIADKIAKTAKTQEEATTAVEGVTLQQVIDSYGDSRANEAQQTAVKNYESKYGLKDGAKVNLGGDLLQKEPTLDNRGGADNDTPIWAKALIETNNALAERLNKIEADHTTSTRKQQLSAIVSKLPASLQRAYDRTPLENLTDDEFATLQNEISEEVQDIVSESKAKGAVFARPPAHGGSNQTDVLTKEQEAAIAHRDAAPKDGQPF